MGMLLKPAGCRKGFKGCFPEAWGRGFRVVAHPLLLRWNGMRWEPKRAMNNRPMNAIEARIPRALAVGVSKP